MEYNYYHDELMVELFEILKQPKDLDSLDLSDTFVENLVLKIISMHGTIRTSKIKEITGLHLDILEEVLHELERRELCAQVKGGFLFSSVDYTITKKGREFAERIMKENPYIGMAPVSYDRYYKVMEAQLKGRFPIEIPEEVIEEAFKGVVGAEHAKEALVDSCTSGRGVFIYGPPGTGKTFLTSKMSKLLPPIIIPKYVEFGGQVVELYDPDFHVLCKEQPEDPRWVKIYAPFVFTGAELSLEKLDTNYNHNKGVYESSPIIKANGGVLLIDDLGRQRDDHEVILNRLIVPMENKIDTVYIRGVPVSFHSHFIPVFSTNLDISIMDEAHLRRAPIHVFLGPPSTDEIAKVFKNNLDKLGELYTDEAIERFTKTYKPTDEGGEGLEPTFAHARDIAEIAQAVRIRLGKEYIDEEVVEEALNRHVLITLQRKNIDITAEGKIRTYRIETSEIEKTKEILLKEGALQVSTESNSVIVDVDNTVTPSQILKVLENNGIIPNKVEIIGETDRELRKFVLTEG